MCGGSLWQFISLLFSVLCVLFKFGHVWNMNTTNLPKITCSLFHFCLVKKRQYHHRCTWLLTVTTNLKPVFLPTITTGGGIMARFWESATTRLLESFSSGIMWAETRKYSVTTKTKQLSKRKPCIFLWNKQTNGYIVSFVSRQVWSYSSKNVNIS